MERNMAVLSVPAWINMQRLAELTVAYPILTP